MSGSSASDRVLERAMTGLPSFTDDTPVPESTLVDLFFEAVDARGDLAALQRLHADGRLEDLSYRQVLASVKAVVASLREAGFERGDRAAILAENRVEWALIDYG